MKYFVIGWMLCAAVFAADAKKTAARPPAKTAKAAKAAAPARKPVPALTIPPGAVKVDETTYHYTDTAGKVWVYQKTPFGISKTEKGAAEAAVTAAAAGPQKAADATPFGRSRTASTSAPSLRIVESGDSVRFEKPTPFGLQTWTKKKSELNDEERAMWEAQRSK